MPTQLNKDQKVPTELKNKEVINELEKDSFSVPIVWAISL